MLYNMNWLLMFSVNKCFFFSGKRSEAQAHILSTLQAVAAAEGIHGWGPVPHQGSREGAGQWSAPERPYM